MEAFRPVKDSIRLCITETIFFFMFCRERMGERGLAMVLNKELKNGHSVISEALVEATSASCFMKAMQSFCKK